MVFLSKCDQNETEDRKKTTHELHETENNKAKRKTNTHAECSEGNSLIKLLIV